MGLFFVRIQTKFVSQDLVEDWGYGVRFSPSVVTPGSPIHNLFLVFFVIQSLSVFFCDGDLWEYLYMPATSFVVWICWLSKVWGRQGVPRAVEVYHPMSPAWCVLIEGWIVLLVIWCVFWRLWSLVIGDTCNWCCCVFWRLCSIATSYFSSSCLISVRHLILLVLVMPAWAATLSQCSDYHS